MIDPEFNALLNRGIHTIINGNDLLRMLRSGKSLRLKMGFDPTRPDIHLGHVVGLRKIRQFQDLGHRVTLVVGDWTAQIGDPSGQDVTRPVLSHAEVKANADSYLEQFFTIVDRNEAVVEWQSSWYGDFTLTDVLDLTNRFTVNQLLHRSDFNNRYVSGKPISMTELLYPILQAYDSVVLHSDIEFGGSDQLFNLMAGRDIQVSFNQPPQQCLLTPILIGTDGIHKMSKSYNNYIAVNDTPIDMYGKLMSIPDSLICDYLVNLTEVPVEYIEDARRSITEPGLNPMQYKKELAWLVTKLIHGNVAADQSRNHFEKVVQNKGLPDDIHEFDVSAARVLDGNVSVRDIIFESNLTDTKTQATRLIRDNAVKLIKPDGEIHIINNNMTPITDASEHEFVIAPGDVIQAGKRRFVKLV